MLKGSVNMFQKLPEQHAANSQQRLKVAGIVDLSVQAKLKLTEILWKKYRKKYKHSYYSIVVVVVVVLLHYMHNKLHVG